MLPQYARNRCSGRPCACCTPDSSAKTAESVCMAALSWKTAASRQSRNEDARLCKLVSQAPSGDLRGLHPPLHRPDEKSPLTFL